jgi:4-hydroxy-tetrahydrodipicolinate synthase
MVIRLAGVMCALVTPMDENGEVDLEGLERLVQRVVDGGVTGICPVGSTGEGPRLSAQQRHAVVRRVRALVPDGFPVIPSPATAVATRTAEDVEALAALGCDAVLVAPPSGYLLDDDEVRRFYEELAARSPLPIVMYNFPALTRVRISPAVVGTLAHHERIIGVKDSSRELEYTQAALYASSGAQDFVVLTGSDTMLIATLMVGGSGAIVGSANLVPELGVAVYDATLAGDWVRAREAQRTLFEVVSAARAAGFPGGWKAALDMVGVCAPYPAPPALPVSGEALALFRKRLEELKVL